MKPEQEKNGPWFSYEQMGHSKDDWAWVFDAGNLLTVRRGDPDGAEKLNKEFRDYFWRGTTFVAHKRWAQDECYTGWYSVSSRIAAIIPPEAEPRLLRGGIPEPLIQRLKERFHPEKIAVFNGKGKWLNENGGAAGGSASHREEK